MVAHVPGMQAFRRYYPLATVSMAALVAATLGAPALAQTAPTPATPPSTSQAADPAASASLAAQPTAAGDTDGGEVIVTGSRIVSSGYSAPTPTTVIGEAQIQSNAQPNIFTTIAQLP